MLYTSKNHGRNFAKDPAVVRLGDKYFLYYSVWVTEEGKERLGIEVAISDDLTNWTYVKEIKPVLDCERAGIGAPGAIVIDNKVHLFYQTYGNCEKDAICHAVSENGLNFDHNPTNPVFRPSNDFCIGRAIDADVCIFNNKLFMYIATRDHNMECQKLACAYASLDSSFSRGDWTEPINQSVLYPEMEWEDKCIEAPATIVVDNKLYLFYGGAYNCHPQQIGCALSDDGIFFRRLWNKPFIANGEEGTWNSDESGHPFVFKDKDGRIYLFYQGTNDKGLTWYISKYEIAFIDGLPVLI